MPKKRVELVNHSFAGELELIEDLSLRAFTVSAAVRLSTDYFWSAPASSSGKYHPECSAGKFGLIFHTKLVVYWATELAVAMEKHPRLTNFQFRDVLVSIAILHDMVKSPKNVSTHGVQLADAMCKAFLKLSAMEKYVIFGVATHMGRWTDGGSFYEGKRLTMRTVQLAAHLADYCASRKVDSRMALLLTMKGAWKNDITKNR